MASALPQDENQRSLEISEKNAAVREMYREKVAEKRETDVNLIKLRQCLITPFPTGTFTRLQYNQIWEMVMEYVTTPLDIDNAQRTCPTFQDILFGKIPNASPDERQVSAVVKILRKGKYLESTRTSNGCSYRYRGPLWHLRLVSKSWQRAMDQAYLEEFEGEWHLEVNDGVWWKDDINFTKLKANADVDIAWSVLKNSNSRSSLLQIICLNGDCITEMGMGFSYSKILEFLDIYGESVKGLVVEWTGIPISWASKYLDLLKLVLRMPNLKALTIDVSYFFGWSSKKEEEVDMNELKDLMLSYRFPPLLSLEVLSFQGRFSWLSTEPLAHIVSEIVSKSLKLKSVGMDDFMLENESIRRGLEGREIEFINCYDNLSEKTWLSLSQFPLRKIALPFVNSDEKPYSESKFAGVVNLFGSTLECLQMPMISSDFKDGPVPLQLPKLRKLKLPLCEGLTNFDFLIPLSGLEHLEFSLFEQYRHRKNCEDDPFCSLQIKKFYELEKSEIWTIFPKLGIVRVFGLGNHSVLKENFRYVRRGNEITKELEFCATSELSIRHFLNWKT